ncbi:gamma tubulin complex component c-terminal [Holotrichia oblita]|uniref:Gamma tubulin complex component c-terminal n=1 Tax=Holotrichia oblita TaxID=644536 RepID=A0ACB9TM33_HOLOL|nr:gamma tubulin complex component c-terminal [Holotrichia oblita]
MYTCFRIIKCVNTIFYRHLCNWIIYGEIVDVHNEFFICDGHCPDENFLYQEQLTDGVTFSKAEAAWTFTTHHDHNHSLYQVPSLNFNTKNTIYNIILLLLEVCNEFCLIATTWNAELNELEVRELNELEKRADNLTEMLLRILYNIHQKVSGPDLLQLLYRLDFNRWYSKNKPDFNLSSV